MTSYVTPKKNSALILYISLPDAGDSRRMKGTPTLAAGDFQVSIDGGALANLATLPTNTPASSKMLKISLSSAEMNGDNITVVCSDQTSPPEWTDVSINIQTSARQIDDLAFPATSGRSMVVDASGLVDANAVKVGPTGSGTAQTAGDLAAMVTAVDDFVDTEVAAIKVNTDKMVFTVANQLDVNVLDWKGSAAPAMTGDAFARLGAPAGASVSADVAAVKSDSGAIKVKTDSLTFTVPGMADVNVVDWKGSAAVAMTGDAYARLGAPSGASVSVDIAAINSKTTNLPSDPADASDIAGAFSTVNSTLATIAGYIDTEIATLLSQTTAAAIRGAVGLSSANLDTQLDALPTNAELATALGTADDAVLAAIAALSIPTANQNADALLDRANAIETGYTLRAVIRIMAAVLAGKVSGAATATNTFRDLTDAKDRVTSSVDTDGNRSAVTLDGA